MNKYAVFLTIVIPAAILMCGCEEYHPTNSPRETVTMKSNFLTTVTTIETSRPETYSEYISSLKEASLESEAVTVTAKKTGIGQMEMDTAVQRQTETLMPAQTAVTAPPSSETAPPQTAVTGITSSRSSGTETPTEEGESASQQTAPRPEKPEAVTAPPFDLADIPPVPSAAVSADTAIRRNN